MTNANNLPTIVEPSSSPEDPDYVPPAPPRRRWLRRWWWVIAILTPLTAIGVLVVFSLLTYVPYVIESPGNLYTTGDRISISGAQQYATADKIDLVTVSLDTEVTRFDKFFADHDSDDVLIPAKEVLGDQTPAQNEQLNELLMKQSKDAAVLVALERLGYDVHPKSTGAVIEETVPGAPADGVLNVAETIVAIDEQPIATADDVHTVLGAHKPGDKVKVTVEANDDNKTRRTVELTLAENKDKPGVAFLGVGPTTRLEYPDLPVNVTVASGSIGGPSAGLAFTLGILDLMSPGDLTGGQEVAATGTISADGTVGPIGGIESKAVTVARQHVKYFLVPEEDAKDAEAHAPAGLQIVPVHTLDDALAFLKSIGGADLPAPPAPSGQ